MGLLSGFAWNQLTSSPHPVINGEQCVNRYRRRHCSSCIDICPEDIIGKNLEVKNWAGCRDCGRCVSVCETRAITPSEHHLEQLLPLREVNEDTIWLSCEKTKEKSNMVRSCLGEISWEHLVYLSFSKKIVLNMTSCKDCPEEACRELLGSNLKKIHSYLGGEHFKEKFLLARDEEAASRKEMQLSRRDMMGHTARMSTSGMKTLLKQYSFLNVEELQMDGVSSRKLLHGPMKKDEKDYYWEIPAVTGTCTGCEACVKACPTKALHLTEDKADLILEPWRCVNCYSCEMACPKKVFKGRERIRIQDFSPLRLLKVQIITCRSCGAIMRAKSQNGLCGECTRQRIRQAGNMNKKGS